LETNSAFLEIFWENSFVALKFEVPTIKTAMASIDKVLAGPTANDYYSAANFLYQSNNDLAKSLVYINKSLDLSKDKTFWYLRLKSLIQAKQGDKSAAIETAKLSLEAAEEAKNQDYVKMNKDSIAEWSKK
jgi:tetratricopeptide (TPR) repeat protein